MAKGPKHRQVLGENIRSMRQAEALTEKELAKRARLAVAHLERLEKGQSDTSVDELARIAKALRTTVHELTSGL